MQKLIAGLVLAGLGRHCHARPVVLHDREQGLSLDRLPPGCKAAFRLR